MKFGYPNEDGTETIYQFSPGKILPERLLGETPDHDLVEELLENILKAPYAAGFYKGCKDQMERELTTAFRVVEDYHRIKTAQLDSRIDSLNRLLLN
jgi:hypothetical protein